MKVVVGLSGGVDSSVTAYLLKQAGHEVVGLFMRNWEEDGHCPASEDYDDVAAVCDQLDIPFYSVNFTQDYWETVFEPSLQAFRAGETPNPDVWCNQQIKFRVFYEKARSLGAQALATGHYCRTDGKHLLRGQDSNKDQSYFLYRMPKEVLPHVLFPIGHLDKPEVRRIAQDQGLVTARKRDSTGICFIGKRDFKSFLSEYLPQEPGDFVTLDGQRVGRHDGCAYYTLGQRKGLGIGGPGEPWFVVGKDLAENIVYVVQGEAHPALWCTRIAVRDLHWISEPKELPFECTAKVRYRSPDVACKVAQASDGSLQVEFKDAQKAVTPGQSLVLYDKERCLGGGIIYDAQLQSTGRTQLSAGLSLS